jgi:hypothetical protein
MLKEELEGLICLARWSEQEEVVNFAVDGGDDVAVNYINEEQVNEAEQRFCRPFRMSVVWRKQISACLLRCVHLFVRT